MLRNRYLTTQLTVETNAIIINILEAVSTVTGKKRGGELEERK